MNRSGQPVVRVSRFRALDSDLELPTEDISGPLFSGSSPSDGLHDAMESRLREILAGNGCPLYALTWHTQDMPAGQPISRLQALGRRTSGSASSGWPTPVKKDDNKSVQGHLRMKRRMGGNRTAITSLQVMAKTVLTGWATPRESDATKNFRSMDGALREAKRRSGNNDLGTAVMLTSGWPTPSASDPERGTVPPLSTRRTGADLPAWAAMVTGWSTPTSKDSRRGSKPPRAHDKGIPLSQQAPMAGWVTPNARDWKDTDGMRTEATNPDGTRRDRSSDQLSRQVFLSPVRMGNTVQRPILSPAFSLWLMGFPPRWLDLAPHSGDWLRWQVLMAPVSSAQKARALVLLALRGMQSSRSWRRRSSLPA